MRERPRGAKIRLGGEILLTFLYVLLALLAAALVASGLLGWKVSSMVLHPKNWPYDTIVDEEEKRGHFTRDWFERNVRLEECTIPSPFGYNLHAAVWPHEGKLAFADGKPRVAVIVHGFTYCLLGGIKYASIFHSLGFDCVLYDHRNHGLSDRALTTMGVREARDLCAVCDWARERFGADAILGTQGESMGASTVMLHAPQDPALAFAIEDCGYSDLNAELRFALTHRFHLPWFPVLAFASLFSRLRGGVFFGSVVPKQALKHCESLPMLFLHGDADELVPFSMLKENYDAKPGKKQMRVFPGAPHAGCYHADPDAYAAYVTEFLTQNGILPSKA